ncbi:TIGR02391 family protein [Geodermatophilus sp. SYSU D00079]
MSTHIPLHPAGTIEAVCQAVGGLYTGTELTTLMAEVPLRDDPGLGITKWRRLAHAVGSNQAKTRNGNALVRLITVAMAPSRTLSRKREADAARDELNQALSLVGLKVREDGRVGRAPLATTDSEALDRTTRLRRVLEQRGAHNEVVAYCRPELLRTDYYEAVFEAIKGLGARIRGLTGVDADGYNLIEQTMAGAQAPLRINDGKTRTERDEQLGVANLAKGLFSAFRNPVAHEPRIHWQLTEQDALDVLGTLSLIHRRLDARQ